MPVTEKRIKYNSIHEVFSYIVENEIRNELINQDILENIKEGRNIIALTERTAHVQKLYDLLKNKIKNIYTLTGKLTDKERKVIREKLRNVPDYENILIIATGKYIGEGFDYPRLDTLFLTFPISWKGRLQQYAGRLHRLYEGKKEVYIYDYVDIHIRVLERMYQKRLKGYASIGYKVKSDLKEKGSNNVIFDNTNFLSTFSTDIAVANKQIYIVSPYINKRKTADILKLLSGALEKMSM
ncbi:MAG: helicase-related protein [bacterium]